MGKSAPSAPPPVNPVLTAQAQTQSNLATAQQQATLNNVNQVTPYGSLTYQQPGGPNTPFTATQQLSPQEQNLLNLSQNAQTTYGNIGNNQLNQVASSLSTPINTDWSGVQKQYIDTQMGLIQPQLEQTQQALASQLENQGVAQGSDAWNNAMRSYNNQVAQTYASVLQNAQTGVGNAISQQESLRDQPLNEASALLTGSQVNPGTLASTPQTSMNPTDVLGAYQMQQNSLWNAYNAQMQNYSATQGGEAGLAGTAIAAVGVAI